MSLADLIRNGPSTAANANPSNPANAGLVRSESFAKLAPLAAANPPNAANDAPNIFPDPAAAISDLLRA